MLFGVNEKYGAEQLTTQVKVIGSEKVPLVQTSTHEGGLVLESA